MRGSGVTVSPSINAYVTEWQSGQQQGTGTKSRFLNRPADCVSLNLRTSGTRLERGGPLEKSNVGGDALPFGIDHHKTNSPGFPGEHKLDNLRMKCGFPAGELHSLRGAFGTDEVIEHLLHFRQAEIEARPRVRKAQRTVHVPHTVDLNDAQAGMLLMLRAESAGMRA